MNAGAETNSYNNDDSFMIQVERYDTENQIWETVDSIKIARSALSLTVLDGKLFAMGGFDGHQFLSM